MSQKIDLLTRETGYLTNKRKGEKTAEDNTPSHILAFSSICKTMCSWKSKEKNTQINVHSGTLIYQSISNSIPVPGNYMVSYKERILQKHMIFNSITRGC